MRRGQSYSHKKENPMKRGSLPIMAALLMAAAASGRNPYFDTGRRERMRQQRDKHFKERAHKLYAVDQSEREFVINGESIMAHDRKTALKIYANHHPEKKSKKHKK